MPPSQIVDKPALHVVGMQVPFISAMSPDATNFEVIGPLWNRFVQRAHEVAHRVGNDTMYGIITNLPAAERTHPHEMLYLAGVAVSAVTDLPTGMVEVTVPAATFAVFTHRGPIKSIGATIEEIYRVWLPSSRFGHTQVADVELYDNRFCVDGADSEMEYWISVAPAKAT
jgi:AraC family transcriptional regulator